MKLVLIVRLYYLIGIFLILDCGSIKPPPITFTQSQTSAERQIVGEKRDLEENAWLIASTQTSSSGSDEWQKEQFDNLYGKVFTESARLLVYLEDEIRKNKKKVIIGESYSGYLEIVPGKENRLGEREEKRVKDILLIVNQHRKILLEERIKYEIKQGGRPSIKMEENLRMIYLNGDDKGNYQELSAGKWTRKS